MSPAESRITSPTATSSRGSSRSAPSRSTVAVVCSMPVSLSATLPLRVSCTKRRAPERATMAVMMTTVAQLRSSGAANTRSVKTETPASASSTTVKGLRKAAHSRLRTESFRP